MRPLFYQRCSTKESLGCSVSTGPRTTITSYWSTATAGISGASSATTTIRVGNCASKNPWHRLLSNKLLRPYSTCTMSEESFIETWSQQISWCTGTCRTSRTLRCSTIFRRHSTSTRAAWMSNSEISDSRVSSLPSSRRVPASDPQYIWLLKSWKLPVPARRAPMPEQLSKN